MLCLPYGYPGHDTNSCWLSNIVQNLIDSGTISITPLPDQNIGSTPYSLMLLGPQARQYMISSDNLFFDPLVLNSPTGTTFSVHFKQNPSPLMTFSLPSSKHVYHWCLHPYKPPILISEYGYMAISFDPKLVVNPVHIIGEYESQ